MNEHRCSAHRRHDREEERTRRPVRRVGEYACSDGGREGRGGGEKEGGKLAAHAQQSIALIDYLFNY